MAELFHAQAGTQPWKTFAAICRVALEVSQNGIVALSETQARQQIALLDALQRRDRQAGPVQRPGKFTSRRIVRSRGADRRKSAADIVDSDIAIEPT